MLTIIRSEPSKRNSEAQAFFAEQSSLSFITRLVGLVAALDATCVVFVLLAA